MTGQLPELTDRIVERYARLLNDSPAVVRDLQLRRGWTPDTIAKIGIGWDGNRIWIPIRDVDGKLVNARLYDPFKRNEVKSFHYANSTNTRRTVFWLPFGWSEVKDHDEVWIVEGEPDAILAAQMGFPVGVITGGAGTWTDELVRVIGRRKLVVCPDMDAAGERGARAWAVRAKAAGLEVVTLKFEVTGKDFTDAVMKDGRPPSFFKKLAEAAWSGTQIPAESSPVVTPIGGGVPGEPVIIKAHVVGGGVVPALIPSSHTATCRVNWSEKACRGCPVGRAQGTLNTSVDPESQDLLTLMSSPQRTHDALVKELHGIPARCPMVTLTEGGYWAVLPLKVIAPMLERHGGDSAVRSAVFVSPADGRVAEVSPNAVFAFRGRIRQDPRSNEWLLASSDARPTEDGVDSFVMTDEIRAMMVDAFRPKEWTAAAVLDSMESEAASLARHVTRIYGRTLLLQLVDLVFHSVVSFKFRGHKITRGWLSAAVIGDTRTGKSETISAFIKHVGLGRMIMDPANTTFAGLVGGLQQIGTGDRSWSITWGIIPTNDRGLVAVDELSSLSTNDIGRMSGMRSSGVAEITKIRTQSTAARTRLIMAGNPRGTGRSLASYTTPAEALMELIGAPEDVARFDLAIAVKAGLNKGQADVALGDRPEPVPGELRRDLVRFAWSRSHESVTWEPGAEDACDAEASGMLRDYDASIPLVEPSEQELRIARVAVALAVRTASFDSADNVVVRKCHCEAAATIIRSMLDGDLMYREYGQARKRRELNTEQALKALETTGMLRGEASRVMLRIRLVTANAVSMATGLERAEVASLLSQLVRLGALDFDDANPRSSGMVWTPSFLSAMRTAETMPDEEVSMDDMRF